MYSTDDAVLNLTGNLIAAQILDLGRDPTVEKLQKMLNGQDPTLRPA